MEKKKEVAGSKTRSRRKRKEIGREGGGALERTMLMLICGVRRKRRPIFMIITVVHKISRGFGFAMLCSLNFAYYHLNLFIPNLPSEKPWRGSRQKSD